MVSKKVLREGAALSPCLTFTKLATVLSSLLPWVSIASLIIILASPLMRTWSSPMSDTTCRDGEAQQQVGG